MTQKPFGVKDFLQPDAAASEALQQKATIDYKSEMVRKGIHLCSLAIPVIYYFISQRLALYLLVPMASAFLVTDLARLYSKTVAAWYYRWFGWLLRQHEQDANSRRLNGATNILLSAILCVLLFPKVITVNAFAILIISDTTSALIGRRYGKRRFLGKSLEGTIAFFVSAIVVVFIAPKIEGIPLEYGLWILAAAVGAVTEATVSVVDDNITVPLSIALAVWGLYLLFLPTINLYAMT